MKTHPVLIHWWIKAPIRSIRKTRLIEIVSVMQAFYFFVKFSLVLIYILKVYRKKNPLRFYWKKNCSIHYLHFLFEKHAPSQVSKDFSVENVGTTPGTFLFKFSSEIYLSRIINYWDSNLTLHLTWGVFSLICVLSVFYFFVSFSIGTFLDRH